MENVDGVFAQASVMMTNGVSRSYGEGEIKTYSWGVHILALDQEDIIPWTSIQTISIDQ